VTLGADKGYDRKESIQELLDHQVTPHIACKANSPIDARTTRHLGYAISQNKRKRIEEIFGRLKTVAGLRKTRHRGIARVEWMFTLHWQATTCCGCATWCWPCMKVREKFARR
jgi:IS5 family transposase